MPEILTPRCPLCDQPPRFIVSIEQAFCGSDNCTMLCWDPSMSLADNLLDAGVVRLPPGEEGGADDTRPG